MSAFDPKRTWACAKVPGSYFVVWGKLDQRTISPSPQSRRSAYSAAVAIGTRGQDGLGTGCHHFATPISFAITFAAL
jgi:hypothetical protein